jgi:hypothetical protein
MNDLCWTFSSRYERIETGRKRYNLTGTTNLIGMNVEQQDW